MRKVVASLLVLIVAVASCSPLPEIERGMDALRGKPIEAAVAKLGRPVGQQPIMGETAYIWSTSFADTGIIPTYGSVGQTTASAYSFAPAGQSSCTLRVFAKDDGIIRGWDVDGNQAACRRYASELR
jgi:hypothetical protein